MSAGDERRARWARQRTLPKPRAPEAAPTAGASPAAAAAPSVKPNCDGCQKPEPLVAAKDGKILCAACAREKPHEPEIGNATPELRELQIRAIADGPFALGCRVAWHHGTPVRVYAPATNEDDDDPIDQSDGAPSDTAEFFARVVGAYSWPDNTVTFFFREAAPPPTGPKP